MLHVLVLSVLLLSGCAWRTGQVEHYVGPVLFRYMGPPGGEAHVIQVKHLGLSGEVGTQWGLSVGLSERTAIAPQAFSAAEPRPPIESARWSMPLSLLSPPVAERWNLSFLYLRGEGVPKPRFVRRVIYGVGVHFGSEARAVSVGVASRTLLEPPMDALSVLRFDESRPLETRFAVWHDAPELDLPVSEILKEVEP